MDIDTVGILGAGTMGSALAQKFSQEGMKVVMVDTEGRFLERGLKNIRDMLGEAVSRGILTEKDVGRALSRISATTHNRDLASCQLVIEAVFEDLDVKQDVLARISDVVSPETILATNTSSFSVSQLSQSVSHPERFLGLHFFYHAAKNRLVEVVRGKSTRESIYRDALWFMSRCGKDAICCRDSHGFVVNRFFVPWLNEAVRIHEEGLAGTGAVDMIARETFGCTLGPFALMNATGVPIAYFAGKTLGEAFGSFYEPAPVLKSQAESGQPWTITQPGEVEPAVGDLIARRLLAVIFLVSSQLLDERVCGAGDINRGARIGLQWKKGPVELYDRYGGQEMGRQIKNLVGSWGLSLPQALSDNHWQMDFVTVDKRDGTGILTMNRPEDLNALNPSVIRQLSDAFSRLDDDGEVETIVITGQGKAFVAGADVKFFVDHIKSKTVGEIARFTAHTQDLFQRIDDSPKTVVAVVNGFALGGGLELALAADIIVALDRARFSFPETGIGIYPGLGGTQRTVRRIGSGLTKYLVYTGSTLFASRAREMGLIDKVIGWEEYREILDGNISVEKTGPLLDDDWRAIETFFNRHTVSEFLASDKLLSQEMLSERWLPMVKQIQSKAPRALLVSESLIDGQKGTTSELEHLEEIFATEDALVGLQSVGRKSPRFRGR
ncbi:MAG: 3-hydroxyacyl-CoA dehydrogenase/enoyl-CoA hydratase family protein [Fidelibacterota bacterium]